MFVQYCMSAWAPGFVDHWMSMLQQKYGYLEHYNGPVLGLAFHPDHKMFKASFWQKWSYAWTASPKTFDRLLEQILKEKK